MHSHGVADADAYPVAGSQRSFIQVLPIILAMVCLGDFFLWQRSRQSISSQSLQRISAVIFLFCIPVTYLAIVCVQVRAYDSLPSLDLPGAYRIHLPIAQARDYRWLVQNLKEQCDSFVGLPGIPSLYIWTAEDPPAGIDADAWMLVYTNQQQMAVAADLSEHPNACVIYNPDLVTFWNRDQQNMDVLPLVRYIHTNFKVVGAADQYYFLVRKERNNLTAISPP